MIAAVRLCVGLFTIVPVPVGTPSRVTVRWAVLLAPAVGALVGLVGAAAVYAVREPLDIRSLPAEISPLSSLLAACIGVLVIELLTGGMHMDGLADTIDGLAARGDRERTLAVMRDSATGAMGALAIALTVAVDIAALGVGLVKGHATELLITAVIAGRVAVVWGCTIRPARPEGLGAWVGGTVTWRSATVVTALAVGFAVLVRQLDDDPVTAVLGYAVLPVGVGVALLVLAPLVRRIGGMTGDVLGALAEVGTASALVLGAVLMG